MERVLRERIEGRDVVFRRRAGKWQFDLIFDGRRRRRNGGASLDAARLEVLALIRGRPLVESIELPPDRERTSATGPTLYECTTSYLRRVKLSGRLHSERTARRFTKIILEGLGERTRATTLTQDRVEAFLEDLSTSHERAKAARYLKAVLNDAVRRERLSALPCRIRVPSVRNAYRPSLKPEEVARLLEAADWRSHPLILLAVTSGARHRELTSRQWRDFDAEAPSITISVQPDAGFNPKTAESTRRIRLPAITAEHLQVYRFEPETAADRTLTSTDWLFPNTPGSDRPWEQQAVCKAVREVFVAAGLSDIPGAGLHCLRRTWATLGLESGHSLATVQREGGWSSPKVLLESYARPTEEQRARLAEGVAGALGLGGGRR